MTLNHYADAINHIALDRVKANRTLENLLNVITFVILAALAASYAFELARNHPFVDGNKRNALVVSRTFLRLNNADIVATKEDKYLTFLALAAGDISEELTVWFRKNMKE